MLLNILASVALLVAEPRANQWAAMQSERVLPIAYQAYKPKYYHWTNSIINFGDSIELEDGSQWSIAPTHAYKATGWRIYDPIIITPNHSWFSSYTYCITNQATGSYVEANFYLSPIPFGPYTHWVVALDKYAGHVFLEDGSSWKVSHDDWRLFEQWLINDFIIIGYNDVWFSSYDHILINVNAEHHIRVTHF